MKPSDYCAFGLLLAFGLWLIVFPDSVIKVYTSFHRGQVKMPGASGVRIAGIFWAVLVALVGLIAFRKK